MEMTHEESGGERQSAGSPSLSLDEMFEILKNERRRFVLQYLQERTDTELAELADHATAVENDTDVDAITSTQRKRVYVSLYQFHLPKMADMGIVEFDQDRGIVSLTPTGKELIDRHERTQSSSEPSRLLGLLTVIGLLATVVSVLAQSVLFATVFLALQTAAIGVAAGKQYLDHSFL